MREFLLLVDEAAHGCGPALARHVRPHDLRAGPQLSAFGEKRLYARPVTRCARLTRLGGTACNNRSIMLQRHALQVSFLRVRLRQEAR